MQTTIAQIVACTIHGNAFLSGIPSSNTADFYPGNSTFTFCEFVRFVDLPLPNESTAEKTYAPDPAAWFTRLKQDGVRALRMAYLPSEQIKLGEKPVAARMLAGFIGGGGRWVIEAVKLSSSDYWEGRWQVGDKNHPDRKIWRVTYGRISRNQPSPNNASVDLDALKASLDQTLGEIAAFARAHQLDNFAKAFEKGKALLEVNDPLSTVFHSDIGPRNFLPVAAAQLLAAVQVAWVFGGMGSWNDLGFEGDEQVRYDKLSEELYQLLNQAVVAATNSSIPSLTAATTKAWWQWF